MKPKELYRLGNTFECCIEGGQRFGSWSLYSNEIYKLLRDHTPEFGDMAAFQAFVPSFSGRRSEDKGPAQRYAGEFVSGNYFHTFGIGAFAGRMISPTDDQPSAPPVVVMSYRTWQQRFALDPSVVGSTFMINQLPYTVAGIAPPGFFGETLRSDPPDFWMPLATEPAIDKANPLLNSGFKWLYAIGRLKPGVQPARVQSEVTLELQQWLGSQANLTGEDRSASRRTYRSGSCR